MNFMRPILVLVCTKCSNCQKITEEDPLSLVILHRDTDQKDHIKDDTSLAAKTCQDLDITCNSISYRRAEIDKNVFGLKFL